ncbi:hypothetical protein TgHK011_009265 [Trichoderma gracile]|nr:hypothetical protein TgHK011_009265 [Trichoderma gracile]
MGAGSRLRVAVMDLYIFRSECLEIAGRCRPLHALLLVTTILPGHAVNCRPCCCIFFDLYEYIHTRYALIHTTHLDTATSQAAGGMLSNHSRGGVWSIWSTWSNLSRPRYLL